MSRPLEGIRVIELATFVAAPAAGRVLAEFGADVIKVEATNKDPQRFFGNNYMVPIEEDENPCWDIANANKRGIVIDIKTEEGMEIMHKLLSTADIFITNNRPKALKRSGLDYNTLKEKYPSLVYGLFTGYGEKGPDADLPGFDTASFQCRSGLLADSDVGGEYPINPIGVMGDMTSGSILVGGLCAALYKSKTTGCGDLVECSLFGTAAWVMSYPICVSSSDYGKFKYPRTKEIMHPLSGAYYKTSDGEWLQLSIADFNKYFKKLCYLLDLPAMAEDERFQDLLGVRKYSPEVIKNFEDKFATKSLAEWTIILKDADVAFSKLNHFKDVADDPQALANGYISKFNFANGNHARLTTPPHRFASAPEGPLVSCGPAFGMHTQEVLEEIGYSTDNISQMKEKNIIV